MTGSTPSTSAPDAPTRIVRVSAVVQAAPLGTLIPSRPGLPPGCKLYSREGEYVVRDAQGKPFAYSRDMAFAVHYARAGIRPVGM
jgi:hypothetical protein